jgi:hypothetical protein
VKSREGSAGEWRDESGVKLLTEGFSPSSGANTKRDETKMDWRMKWRASNTYFFAEKAEFLLKSLIINVIYRTGLKANLL